MIQESSGKISDELYALGTPELPAYLLRGKIPILFDAGMTFMGPVYLRDLKKHLEDVNRLAYLFLTHSHFDHSGAAPYLKRNIPGLKIAASAQAAEIFKRPNAVELIRSLSKKHEDAIRSQTGGEDITFRGLEVDVPLEDGQEIVLGDYLVRVFTTPGHTRDAVSYYIPRLKALVCGEAVGGLNRNFGVRSVFLSSYKDYLTSLEKLSRLEIEILLMGHGYVLTKEDAREMVSRVIEETKSFKERIERELARHHGDQPAAVETIFREDYVEKKMIAQDERPFRINLQAQVKAIAENK